MILLNILAKTEMIEMDLELFASHLLPGLKIGITLASFHYSGNVPDSVENRSQGITDNVCCIFVKHCRDPIRFR